uniref:Uncharacterized protein n=1 Tax=Kallithea virus TaxID=1654582 RepID=A0A0F7KNH8_9VIRU|nr:hypothetical protein [Kallithea virus]
MDAALGPTRNRTVYRMGDVSEGIMSTTFTSNRPTTTANQNASGVNIPITSNDRRFTCGLTTCEGISFNNDFGGFRNAIDGKDSRNIFNLDFSFMNIELLRQNLDIIGNEVKNVIDSFRQWLHDMEADFEMRVTLGDVDLDAQLFTRLNAIIPKIEQSKRSLDAWYSEFQDSTIDLTESFANYTNIASRIETSYLAESFVNGSGLPENIVTIAKQNQTKSRFIQRQTTKLLASDVRIRSQMQNISFKTTELSTGILRYGDRKELNLNTLAQAFEMLGQTDSPLVRVQKQLSYLINSSPLNYNLTTAPVNLLPSVNKPYTMKMEDPRKNEEYILERMRGILNTTLYTAATAKNIDAINTYIDSVYRNSPRYAEMKKLYNEIVSSNVPHILIESLAQQATEPENIYLLAFRVHKIITALRPQDAIFRLRLDEIASTINRTIQNQLKREQSPSTQINNPHLINLGKINTDINDNSTANINNDIMDNSALLIDENNSTDMIVDAINQEEQQLGQTLLQEQQLELQRLGEQQLMQTQMLVPNQQIGDMIVDGNNQQSDRSNNVNISNIYSLDDIMS